MAKLTAVFELVDRISAKLDAIAGSGESAVDQWERAASSADSAFDAAVRGGTRAAQSVDGVASSTQNMGDAIDSAAREIEDATAAADSYADSFDAAQDAADDLTDALEDLDDQTEETGDGEEDLGKKGVDAFSAISSAMASAGIMKGLQEITGALLDAADAAATVETAFAKLETIAGAGSMDMLTGQIADLSAETGIAQDVLADVAYNAISAGSAVEDAVDTARAATMLATAGFTETSSALSVLSTAMNSYGDSAGSATDISNGLIMVQNLGVTTVAELASSMGKSISTAAAYNVSLSNLESAYVSVTKAGINTAEGTTYISGMLNELGKEGSTVSDILKEETGQSFGQLMQSGWSLADVLSILYDYANNDAEAMMNLWGSQTAGMASAAIINQGLANFNDNLQAIESSAGATESAYSIMADTTEFAHERMTNSAQNLKVAIGDSLTPALDKLYNAGASAFGWAAEFATEHPIVVKAVTAVAVGVGVVAVGIAAVTFATTVAVPAITAFGVALNTALGPIGWVALAITGIVAAGAALIAMFEEEETEYDTWTASTKAQYDALQDLNSEYEQACDTYGETSEEALRLKYEMDDLSASFEANKITVEEFVAQCDALAESHTDLAQSYADATADIDAEEIGTLALIQKLNDLASSSEQTAATQMQMQSIIGTLNETFPDLALNIEDVTENTDAMTEALKKAAEEQANQERYQESYGTYVDLLKEQAALEEKIAAAEENVRLEQERMDKMSGWDHFWTGGEWDDLESYQAALEELQAAYADNLAMQEQCEAVMQEYADATAEAAEETVSYGDAVETALSLVQEEMDELCAAYDEAYTSARTSIDGQIGLFDTMATETELSITDMQSAFDSQIEYLNTYTENLRKAAEYGLDEGLISSLSDGSEESAGYLNAIIENIEALGESSSEAQQFVDDFNSSFQEVESAKDEFATTVATMETDFDTKMAEIEGRLTDAIDNMNMESDAAAAAKDTMLAYTQAIRDGTASAVSAAESAAAAVAAALDTSYAGGVTTTVAGHASGTTNAEDVFVAGENGPELIVGAGGSTVFPADETQRIINAVSDELDQPANIALPAESYTARSISSSDTMALSDETAQTISAIGGERDQQTNYFLPVESYTAREDTSASGGTSEKRVYLEIAGKGNLELTGGKVDDEALLAFLYEYLKPVLAEIVTQEIFEEGDSSYEY